MIDEDSFGVRFTRAWVALYTRSLPEPVGRRRRAEIESDLWEQLNEMASGRVSAGVMSRCLRGVPADVWWRYRTLLEEREDRQRSLTMKRSILTDWWNVITAVFGTAMLTLGVAGVVFGDGGSGGLIMAGATLVSGAFLLGGLVTLRRRVRAGSWMIVAAAAATVPSIFLIPVAALIVIGGLWTGHLRLSATADAPELHPDRPRSADITVGWYRWLIAAPVLFVVGLGALMLLGDGETAIVEEQSGLRLLLGSAVYFAWILSWLAAVISALLGVVLGAMRGIARHRTRPA